MTMRAPAQEAPGTAGASLASANFELLGWGVVENASHDVGTDLFVMARDERRFDLGLLVGVQVKAGPSWFRSEVFDDGEISGWWFSEDQKHWDAWLKHSIPHLIVLQDLQTKISYWVHIRSDSVISTGRRSKIFVPRSHTVDEQHRDALLAVATSRREPRGWEGSAWLGAAQLSSSDLLRYALVVPRLVAPHPNSSGVEATAENCLAMLVLVRINDLERPRMSSLVNVPEMEDAARSPEWRWRLTAAFREYLFNGNVDEICAVARDVEEPADLAAGTAVAATALLEDGRAQEAADLIEPLLKKDRLGPVDHAWLQAHLARAYYELGQLTQARDLALAVQILRHEHADDASATAIAGAAAQLIFMLSGVGDESLNLGDVIVASDSAASWWRTQVMSWGLGHAMDERFVAWVDGEPTENGLNDLRAVTLMSGLTADLSGWRYGMSRMARHRLLVCPPNAEIETVRHHLMLLRLSGDHRNLAGAVQHVRQVGPARAVAEVAAALDLDGSTRSTAQADLTLLQTGADVVPVADVERHVTWLLATAADPTTYRERLKPQFLIEDKLLGTLAALANSAPDAVQRRVRDVVLGLPGIEDQSLATSWARVVRSLPEELWADVADNAEIVAGTHHSELKYALVRSALPHRPKLKARLVAEAAAGDWRAFTVLGDVRQIPPDSATHLVTVTATRLAEQRDKARAGQGYEIGDVDWAWWLTALNVCHPAAADWAALLEHLNDPLAHPDHLTGSLELLAAKASELPTDVRAAALAAVDSMSDETRMTAHVSRPLMRLWQSTDFDGARGRAAFELREAEEPAIQMMSLLTSNAEDRRRAASLIGRRKDPTCITALASLAFDSTPDVQVSAAQAIGYWAATEVGEPTVSTLVAAVLRQPGTRAARAMTAALRAGEHGSQVVEDHLDLFRDHPSAQVRHAAIEFLRRVKDHDSALG